MAEKDMVKIGLEEEKKEHPWMSPENLKKLVDDHINIDPEYYEDEDEDEDDKEEETGIKTSGYTKQPNGKKAY